MTLLHNFFGSFADKLPYNPEDEMASSSSGVFNYRDPLLKCKLSALIIEGNYNAVQEYLQNLTEINTPNNRGLTPLHYCVIMQDVEILKLLLAHPGININARTHFGETALHLSLRRGVQTYSDAVSTELITSGCDVNIGNMHGATPLHYAVSNRRYNIIDILVAHDANLDARNIDGCTPLHEAVMYDLINAVYQLLYYNADTSIRSSFNLTPFMHAVSNNTLNFDVAIVLFDYVTDLDAKTEDGLNSLMLALKSQSSTLVELVNFGANVNWDYDNRPSAIKVPTRLDDATEFKLTWQRLNYGFYQRCANFLNRFLLSREYSKEEWLKCLYLMLNSEEALDLVNRNRNMHCAYCAVNTNAVVSPHLFSNLADACMSRNVEKEDRLKLIYIFLSFGVTVTLCDIFKIYKYYKFGEELEAFLQIPVYFPPNINIAQVTYSPIPICIFKSSETLHDLRFLHNLFTHPGALGEVLDIIRDMLKFCSPHFYLKVRYRALSDQVTMYEDENVHLLNREILHALETVSEVPSLQEICRDKVREALYLRFNIQDSSTYYYILKRLPIPQKIKDIIKFKLPSYV